MAQLIQAANTLLCNHNNHTVIIIVGKRLLRITLIVHLHGICLYAIMLLQSLCHSLSSTLRHAQVHLMRPRSCIGITRYIHFGVRVLLNVIDYIAQLGVGFNNLCLTQIEKDVDRLTNHLFYLCNRSFGFSSSRLHVFCYNLFASSSFSCIGIHCILCIIILLCYRCRI